MADLDLSVDLIDTQYQQKLAGMTRETAKAEGTLKSLADETDRTSGEFRHLSADVAAAQTNIKGISAEADKLAGKAKAAAAATAAMNNATKAQAAAAKEASTNIRLQSQAVTQLNDFTQQVAYSGGKLSTVLLAASGQFDQIRSQAGSSAAAFKLLGGAILNPTAIVLTAITLFSLFGDKLLSASGGTKSLKDALEDLKTTTSNYNELNEQAAGKVETLKIKFGELTPKVIEARKELANLFKLQAEENLRQSIAAISKELTNLTSAAKSRAFVRGKDITDVQALDSAVALLGKRYKLTDENASKLAEGLKLYGAGDVLGATAAIGKITEAGNKEFQELAVNIKNVQTAYENLKGKSSGEVQNLQNEDNKNKRIEERRKDLIAQTENFKIDAAQATMTEEARIISEGDQKIANKARELSEKTDLSEKIRADNLAAYKLKVDAETRAKLDKMFDDALQKNDEKAKQDFDRRKERELQAEARLKEETKKIAAEAKASTAKDSVLLAKERELFGIYGEQRTQLAAQYDIRAKTAELIAKLPEGPERAAAEKIITDEMGKQLDILREKQALQANEQKQSLLGVRKALDTTKILSPLELAEKKTQSVFSNMEKAIDNFVDNGKFKFKDFAGSVIKDLIRIELKAQSTALLKGVLGSIFPAGDIPGYTAPIARGGLITQSGVNYAGSGPLKFGAGGVVPGAGNKDSVPALLMPGEYVMNRQQVREAKNAKASNSTVVNNYYTIQGYTDQQLVQKVQSTIAQSTKLVYGASRQGEREAGARSFR